MSTPQPRAHWYRAVIGAGLLAVASGDGIGAPNASTEAPPAREAKAAMPSEPARAGLRRWIAADAAQRESIALELEPTLAHESPETVLAAISSQADLLDTGLAVRAMERWASAAPMSALAWIERLTASHDLLLSTAVRDALEKEPGPLARYLGELPPGRWKDQVALSAVQEAFRRGDAQTAAKWTSLSSSPSPLLTAIATEWARKDFPAAAKWASDQAKRESQDALLAAVATGYAMMRPADAFGFLLQTLPPSERLNQTAATIAGMWGSANPNAVASAAAQMPDGELRLGVEVALVKVWAEAEHSPAEAKSWVLHHPRGSARDRLVGEYARVAAEENPRDAAALVVAEITPGLARDGAFTAVLREWAPFDSAAVRTWIAQIGDRPTREWASARLDAILAPPATGAGTPR